MKVAGRAFRSVCTPMVTRNGTIAQGIRKGPVPRAHNLGFLKGLLQRESSLAFALASPSLCLLDDGSLLLEDDERVAETFIVDL